MKLFREALKKIIQSWDLVPTRGGFWPNPNFFKPKPQPYKKGDFVAILQGFPSPNQKITKTWDFFMKK